jgi:hypothetical protein
MSWPLVDCRLLQEKLLKFTCKGNLSRKLAWKTSRAGCLLMTPATLLRREHRAKHAQLRCCV